MYSFEYTPQLYLYDDISFGLFLASYYISIELQHKVASTWPSRSNSQKRSSSSSFRKWLKGMTFRKLRRTGPIKSPTKTASTVSRWTIPSSLNRWTAPKLYPHVEDWRQAEATLKRRVDTAKFVLGKMAPVLSKRFDKTSKVEISGELAGGPQIAVINYYQEPAVITAPTKVIDHDPS